MSETLQSTKATSKLLWCFATKKKILRANMSYILALRKFNQYLDVSFFFKPLNGSLSGFKPLTHALPSPDIEFPKLSSCSKVLQSETAMASKQKVNKPLQMNLLE